MEKKPKRKLKKVFQDWRENVLSFSWIDGLYERVMRNDTSIKWLALLIVFLIYGSTQLIYPVSWDYAEDVRGKALTAIYDTEKYVVEGLPKTVDFTLEGKEAIVKSLVKTNTFNALVDLSQLKPGQHIVNIDYDVIPSNVKVTSNPKNVSVLIKELKSMEKDIQLEYFNQDLKDPLIELGTPILSANKVEIKGAKDRVEQVVTVKGMIDVSDPSQLKELKVELFAVDKQGNKLDVTLEPNEVMVSIEASIPQKEVLVDLRFEDELPSGKLLKSAEIHPSKILVYAPSSKLETLNALFLSLKASDITESGTYTVNVPMPDGVTKIEPSTVEVKLELEDEYTKVLKKIPVQVNGLGVGLRVAEALTTSVRLRGLEQEVSQIQDQQIKLAIDVTGLNTGTHEVPLQVEKALASQVKVEKQEAIKVTLTK